MDPYKDLAMVTRFRTANFPVRKYNTTPVNTIDAEFRSAALNHHIGTRRVTEMKQLFNGYYAVAGVFGEDRNAMNFMKSLRVMGLHPHSAIHPTNHLNYIYLGYYRHGLDAVDAVHSKLNGQYPGKLWIMDVYGCRTVEKGAGKTPNFDSSALTASDFVRAAADKNILARSQPSREGIASGYYLIAGIFRVKANAFRLAERSRVAGLHSGYFMDPSTKEYFVYLGYYSNSRHALQDAVSKINGRYNHDLWLLEFRKAPDSDPGELAKTAPPTHDSLRQIQPLPLENPMGPSIRKVQKDPPILRKLIEKADAYFKNMRYAEAAELYEKALELSEAPSFNLIHKAGDSHYFNTNMERAYFWYDQLFDKYRDELSAEDLFQYALVLKGTRHYGRAKHVMRLYNRKIASGKRNDSSADNLSSDQREVILDNILNTEEPVSIRDLSINSQYSDFAPMFYQDDKLVFASAMDSAFLTTRRYKWNNQPFLDLYQGTVDADSQEIRHVVKLTKKVNTKYHEAGVTFSPDNNTMYFTRNNYSKKLRRDKNGVDNLKIYQSKKVNGEWTKGIELPFNSDEYSTGHPALSPDGKQLYFVSDMPGSIGGTDIFVVDVHDDGSFSEPRNLGPEINTPRKEMFPFISDSKLYFSSDGHVGLGGLDIYEVAFNDSDGFLEVRNLGKPINSNRDDFSYIINEATQQGFFASNRKGGKGDDDIYSFKRLLPEKNLNAIAGSISEEATGEHIPNAMVELLDENNRKLRDLVAGEDGSFLFEDLSPGTQYILRTSNADYQTAVHTVTTGENEKVQIDVVLSRLYDRIIVENGIKKLQTDKIYFDFDASKIRKDAAVQLDKIVAIMKEHPAMVIKIESHTDSRGSSVYNKYLSDQRAKSSRTYLIGQGIAADRIESAIGYGEERLLNECDGTVRCSEEAHQRNRRSEFIIVHM